MDSSQSIIRFCPPSLNWIKNLFCRSIHLCVKFCMFNLGLSNLLIDAFITKLLINALFILFGNLLYQIQFICRLIGLVWCKNDLMTFFSSTRCYFVTASTIETFCFVLRGIWGSSSIELLESLFYNFFFSHTWYWLYESRLLFTHTAFSHFDKKAARFSMIRCHLVLYLWY